MSIRRELFQILDSLPETRITGWNLHEMILFKTGRKPYPSTLLRYAHEYCDISGGELVCIDPQKRIGKAILEGRE